MKQRIYIVIAVLLCFVSCKTRKIVPASPETSNDYTITQVIEHQPQFGLMNISKMSIVAAYGTQQFAFRATAKLITDSLLVLSIQPVLGVEMFRIEFTPNKFLIVDKWNRRYTENTYDYLQYKFGVNFSFKVLQNIVSDRLYLLDTDVKKEAFFVEMSSEGVQQLMHLGEGLIQRFDVDENNSVTRSETILQQGRLTCTYTGHRSQNGVRFPTHLQMLVSAEEHSLSLDCTVEKIDFNKSFEYTSINISRYEKVTMSKIIP